MEQRNEAFLLFIEMMVDWEIIVGEFRSSSSRLNILSGALRFFFRFWKTWSFHWLLSNWLLNLIQKEIHLHLSLNSLSLGKIILS